MEFKKLANFERPGDEIRMPKAKKRVLSSSSEESASEAEEASGKATETEKTKKNVNPEKKLKTSTAAAATSSSDEQGKAKKANKKDKEKVEKPKEKEVPPEVAKEPPKKPEVREEVDKIIKTTTVKDMLRAKRDNMRKIEKEKGTGGGTTTTTDNEDDEDAESRSETGSSLAISESSRDSHPDLHKAEIANGTKLGDLPDNTPNDLQLHITNVKKIVIELNANGKGNIFDSRVKELLIKIDTAARLCGSLMKNQVYHHLVQFVPCNKQTLTQKIKKWKLMNAEIPLKNELNHLRKVISETMPGVIAKYEHDVNHYNEMQEMSSIIGAGAFSQKSPRKKYHWNEQSRALLNDVVKHCHEVYRVAKPRKESEDDYIVRYLKETVVPLWPDGWVKYEDLQKELDRRKKKELRELPSQLPGTAATQKNANSNNHNSNNNNSNNNNNNNSNSKPVLNTITNQTNHKDTTTTSSTNATKTDKYHHDVPRKMTSELTVFELDSGDKINGKSTSSSPGSSRGGKESPESSSKTSVIITNAKRSSDHSIISIISSPPPTPVLSSSNIHSKSSSDNLKIVDLDKLSNPSDLVKALINNSTKMPAGRGILKSPPRRDSLEVLQSLPDTHDNNDDSDSDCVEIVDEDFSNQTKPSAPAITAPPKRKVSPGDGDEEPEIDYKKLMMDIQHLSVS